MADIPLRVSLFLRYVGGGGAERVILNLACGFIQQGWKVDLVLGKAWGSHLEKVPAEIRVVDLGASGLLSTTLALVDYLQREQPTVLLSALHYANEIAVWAKCLARVPTRVVISEHNTFSQAIQHMPRVKRRLLPFLVRHFYPWADSIVAVSHGVAQDLADATGLSLKVIQTIYNPVITPELLEKAKQPVAHPWFAPGEPPVILGVGKLEAQKDFSTLIRAFAEVRRVRSARLVILGWGPDRPKLEALVQQLDLEQDISLLGYVENPYPYMAHASLFVLSSAWEGLPTVLIEAMAVGTPVVSTNCKSGAAEILANGKYGVLAPVGNSQALAEGILEALSNPVSKENSGWLEQFSLTVSTQQYLNLFSAVESDCIQCS